MMRPATNETNIFESSSGPQSGPRQLIEIPDLVRLRVPEAAEACVACRLPKRSSEAES